jgi:hypothetical protein
MYSLKPPGPRKNRISFYVFNPAGNRGCGSYFQDPIATGQWIQVVGIADAAKKRSAIYKNGEFRHSDLYSSETPHPVWRHCASGPGIFSAFTRARSDPSSFGIVRLFQVRSKLSSPHRWFRKTGW